MSPWDVLKRLSKSAINAGLTPQGNEVTAWLASEDEEVLARETFLSSEFDEIVAWLDARAREHFPESSYARHAAPLTPAQCLAQRRAERAELEELRRSDRKPPKRVERPTRAAREHRQS